MAERRTLTEGMKTTPRVDPAIAEEFVYGPNRNGSNGLNGGGAPSSTSSPAHGAANGATTSSPQLNRVPISTRIREDFARALKRASLERQLNGVEPSTLQAFLEEAIEPWLRQNKLWP